MFIRTHLQTCPKFGKDLQCPDIVWYFLLSAPVPQQEIGKKSNKEKRKDKEKKKLIWVRNLGMWLGDEANMRWTHVPLFPQMNKKRHLEAKFEKFHWNCFKGFGARSLFVMACRPCSIPSSSSVPKISAAIYFFKIIESKGFHDMPKAKLVFDVGAKS